jgi:hypothetical protein
MSNFLIDEDTDLLAAEFVLGTLDSQERANAQSLLRTDHGFIAMVRIWERRFGELHLMVEPVEPDATILPRIKAKIAELPPRAPVLDGKPPPAAAPTPPPPESTGTPANAEMPNPQDAAATGTTPPPAEGAVVSGEAEKSADTPPAAAGAPTALMAGATEIPAVADVQPGPEPQPQELVVPVPGEVAKVAIPDAPTLPPPSLKPAEKPPGRLAGRRPEVAVDVIRSRGRWRVAGVLMALLVVGLVALLAAWRFVPDRLPGGLRPAQVLMSLGIQALPKVAPAAKPAPGDSGFDE